MAMATRRSIQIGAFNGLKEGRASESRIRVTFGVLPRPRDGAKGNFPLTALAARCGAVDEQAAFCDDPFAGLQIAVDLHEIAVGETGLDLTKFDRLVVMRDPDVDLIALV